MGVLRYSPANIKYETSKNFLALFDLNQRKNPNEGYSNVELLRDLKIIDKRLTFLLAIPRSCAPDI